MIDQEQPAPPETLKPWYYQDWFLFPMFIFWPSGAILAIRSPWNSNVMFGGVGWAFIFVFGVLGVRWLNDGVYQPIMTFYVPGVLLTIITQVQWAAYRKKMTEDEEPSGESSAEVEETSPPRPSARRRRRNPRTGRTRN